MPNSPSVSDQDRHRMQEEADRGQARDGDLRQLDPLGHVGLVEAVGQLAAERREDEERRDEDDAGQRDQHPGVAARHLSRAGDAEQDQHGQRVLQEVVVESGAELAPEQRRKPPRRHQALEHVIPNRPPSALADPSRPGKGRASHSTSHHLSERWLDRETSFNCVQPTGLAPRSRSRRGNRPAKCLESAGTAGADSDQGARGGPKRMQPEVASHTSIHVNGEATETRAASLAELVAELGYAERRGRHRPQRRVRGEACARRHPALAGRPCRDRSAAPGRLIPTADHERDRTHLAGRREALKLYGVEVGVAPAARHRRISLAAGDGERGAGLARRHRHGLGPSRGRASQHGAALLRADQVARRTRDAEHRRLPHAARGDHHRADGARAVRHRLDQARGDRQRRHAAARPVRPGRGGRRR